VEACGSCGRPKKAGASFCTGCGQRFAQASEVPPLAQASGIPRRRASWPPPLATLLAVVALLAGTGVTVAVLLHNSHGSGRRELAQISSRTTPITGPASQSPASQSPASPSPASSPSQGALTSPSQSSAALSSGVPGDVQVAVAPSAAQDPDASSVAAFLDEYFTAINTHDYESYLSLQTTQTQQELTVEQFDNGYGSTVDSAEVLTSISTATDGDTVATVTFVSHQNPSESVNGREACTDWSISLFLQQGSAGYLMGQPASGYRPTDSPC
jgi:hypothetical protein